MVFNALSDIISDKSLLLGGGNRSTRRKLPSYLQILLHNVVSRKPRYERHSNSQLQW